MLQGLMMHSPLLITSIMRFAERNHARQQIVSVTSDNPRYRATYAETFARVRRLANALDHLGLETGDRVATLAWNDHRHFELYYAVACSGRVCHTINPRLFNEQLAYIIRHAEDRLVFLDPMFVPLLETLQDQLTSVTNFIIMTDADHMPATTLRGALCYEDLLAAESPAYDWPELEENTACGLSYTSGTTGNPKGVLYSHRALVLHSYAIALPDAMNLTARDCVMPLVPMFHVNAWGTPYALPMVGARLVLPGARMGDGELLHALLEEEQVSYSLGVPTVWLALLSWLEQHGKSLTTLQRVCVGGAACPAFIIDAFRERHAVSVAHAWGMTELSPVGSYNSPKSGMENMSPEDQAALRLRQGRALFGIEMKIVNTAGNEQPWDGVTCGALKVRGPWVCSFYFGAEEAATDADGWFDTGDIATIDADGFMQITDRSKDIIKSGGEWISSIALENIAVGHPDVAEAAVIGIHHPRWIERPLLVVVPKAGAPQSRDAMLAWFRGKVADWWIPNDVIFVSELPHTATGKLKKSTLREQFHGYCFPAAE
jgi:3-(methylthio)propionyl---CoA ligase